MTACDFQPISANYVIFLKLSMLYSTSYLGSHLIHDQSTKNVNYEYIIITAQKCTSLFEIHINVLLCNMVRVCFDTHWVNQSSFVLWKTTHSNEYTSRSLSLCTCRKCLQKHPQMSTTCIITSIKALAQQSFTCVFFSSKLQSLH